MTNLITGQPDFYLIWTFMWFGQSKVSQQVVTFGWSRDEFCLAAVIERTGNNGLSLALTVNVTAGSVSAQVTWHDFPWSWCCMPFWCKDELLERY